VINIIGGVVPGMTVGEEKVDPVLSFIGVFDVRPVSVHLDERLSNSFSVKVKLGDVIG
jgi:hypothetical protein